MDYSRLFKEISDKVKNGINEQYSFERLNEELLMRIPINEQLIDNIIYSICKEMLNALTGEQREIFAKFCERNEKNFSNTMTATTTLYTQNFIDWKLCYKVPEYLEAKEDENHQERHHRHMHASPKRIHIIDDDYEL